MGGGGGAHWVSMVFGLAVWADKEADAAVGVLLGGRSGDGGFPAGKAGSFVASQYWHIGVRSIECGWTAFGGAVWCEMVGGQSLRGIGVEVEPPRRMPQSGHVMLIRVTGM